METRVKAGYVVIGACWLVSATILLFFLARLIMNNA